MRPERVEREIRRLVKSAGMVGQLAEGITRSALGWSQKLGLSADIDSVKVALGLALRTVPWRVPDILRQQEGGGGPPLPGPEGQPDPVPIPEQGTLRRLRIDRPNDRPHIYLWFERLPDSPCLVYFRQRQES